MTKGAAAGGRKRAEKCDFLRSIVRSEGPRGNCTQKWAKGERQSAKLEQCQLWMWSRRATEQTMGVEAKGREDNEKKRETT